jgi:hypothetical protein
MARYAVNDFVKFTLGNGEELVIEPGATIFYNGQAVPGLRWISSRARPPSFNRAGRQSALHSPSSEPRDRPLWCGFKPVPKDEQEQNKPPMLPRE